MIAILDNVLSDKDFSGFKEAASIFNTVNPEGLWFEVGVYEDPYIKILLEIANNYFDLTKVRGYEVWTHNNTKPTADMDGGCHYDKDEYRWATNKVLSFPVCSLVFYLKVDNVVNGNLIVKDISIAPRMNRLVIFGPGTKHRVEDFVGDRFSISINPWNRLLEEYK